MAATALLLIDTKLINLSIYHRTLTCSPCSNAVEYSQIVMSQHKGNRCRVVLSVQFEVIASFGDVTSS